MIFGSPRNSPENWEMGLNWFKNEHIIEIGAVRIQTH